MAKNRYAIFCVAFAALLLSGCLPGLDPSWKAESGRTTLTIRIGSLVTSESLANATEDLSSARAVVQGGGYLYVRTLGGPADESGPFYGPYPVGPDATCRITDIPAGAYSGMGILYSSVALEERITYVNDMPITFVEIMKLPDAEFDAISTGSMVENVYYPSQFENLVAGDASGEMLKDVFLAAGRENAFRLRLKPMTGYERVSFVGQTGAVPYTVSPTPETRRQFIALEGISAPSGSSIVSLSCSAIASPTAGGSITLGRVALYDETGALILADGASSSVLSGSATRDVTAPYVIVPSDGPKTLYLYVEHSSATSTPLVLTFSATLGALAGDQRLTVAYSGGINQGGKRLFFGVYPPSAVSMDGLVGAPVAIGMIVLDSSGNGSCAAVDPVTKEVVQFAQYSAYFLTAFLDNAGNYAGYTDLASITSIDGITPHYGDYTIDGMGTAVAIAVGATNLDISGLVTNPSTTHVRFVATGASGGGQTVGDPTSLSAVFGSVTNLLGLQPGDIEIILTTNDSLDASVSQSIGYRLKMRSIGASPLTLTLAGAATTSSPFLIQGGGELALSNVTVSGSSYSGSISPFNVGMDASLALEAGATIRDFTLGTSSSGGAITIYGGKVKMSSATIDNCAAERGGGVFIGYGSTSNSMLTMFDGAIIQNCSATTTGGGVHIDGMAAMTLASVSSLPSITLNDAGTDGGGVYIAAGGTLYDQQTIADSVVTGNTILGAGTNDIANYGQINNSALVMYVTQSGTGSGLTSATPASFATALATTSVVSIVLMEDVTLSTPIEVSRVLTISSANALGNALLLASNLANPFISVSSSSTLQVNNVRLGPATAGGGATAPSIVRVGYGCSLYLGEGSSVRNNGYSGDGAGVYLEGGYLTLSDGSSISGCSSGSYKGGGVYAGSYFDGSNTYGSSVMVNGGSITGCSADLGGGVYLASPSSMYLYGSTFSITGNSAGTLGGGAYAQTGSSVTEGTTGIAASNITGNTAGGVAESPGVTTGN